MNLLFWGLTIGMIGKIMLGIAVLRVHLGIFREHKIDNVVLKSIVRERYVTYIAILLIAMGYVLEVAFYGETPLFTCTFGECGAALNAAFSITP